MTEPLLLMDADVFISAKNRYYAFDICPGFWDSLVYHFGAGNIRSIDKVRNELLAGRNTEDLYQWAKNLPTSFFLDTTQVDVVNAYTDIMLWVQQSPQYFDRAKAKFATEADGWLVAYGGAHCGIVVTNEQPRPESRNRVLLPDICNQFGVAYKDTFEMLKLLQISFDWHATE